jgi:hypothetical protein
MRKLTLILLGLLIASTAHATSHRTFVAAEGVDSGTCGPTAPCRSLSYALSQTNSGGEIIITSSGGYGDATGGLTINKSVSIIAQPGIFAALAPTSGNGVTIATAGIDVLLKGLTINGRGGNYGIHMTNGTSLTVENCSIGAFGSTFSWTGLDEPYAGIYVETAAKITVVDTTVYRSFWGMRFAGGANVEVSRSRALRNFTGIAAVGSASDTSNTIVSINDTLVSHNRSTGGTDGIGFWSAGTRFGCSGCSSNMTIANSVASDNYFNFNVHGASNTISVASSQALNGGYGFYSGGTFNSANNNVLTNNTVITSGIINNVAASVIR